jgi:uncharacterized protein YjbI with pentapeptide repeats
MIEIQSLTMAKTIGASTNGLHIVDKARRKKMWKKSEKAWVELVPTSVATLRRFWAGLAIQAETFQGICEAVGVKDWELIADYERVYEKMEDRKCRGGVISPDEVHQSRLSFAIKGSIDEIDKKKLDAIVILLQTLVGDTTIEIVDIDEGSIKLILGGSPKAIEMIEALFRSGKLTQLCGTSVQDVHIIDKNELCLLIKKNGGSALNFKGANLNRADLNGADLRVADLSGVDLHFADLRGADLRGANLRGANLSNARLSEANLSHTDLSGIDLRAAHLRNAILSGAVLRGANLRAAILRGTDLSGADLSTANLFNAVIAEADLSNANLNNADLTKTNLRGAILHRAVLRGADLRGADLREAELSEAYLYRTRFGNNLGLKESDILNLKKRGGIVDPLGNSR